MWPSPTPNTSKFMKWMNMQTRDESASNLLFQPHPLNLLQIRPRNRAPSTGLRHHRLRPAGAAPVGPGLGAGLKDTVPERPYHSNIWPSEFRRNSVRIQQNYHNFSEILTNNVTNSDFRTSQHFLECSAKFRKKSSKSVQNSMKIVE